METLQTLDINLDTPISSSGTAFYRLPKEMKEFLEKCQKEHRIIGFEWDGSYNFGVILKDNNLE